MLERILEPEAMDNELEALEYDLMDHAAVNRAFVEDFLRLHSGGWPVLDLGAGTALIPIELCERRADAQVLAVDLAWAMLRRAQAHLRDLGLTDRILLIRGTARRIPLPDLTLPAVMSNSLIHHLADPMPVIAEMERVLAPGGTLFLRDLFRPPDTATLERLVAQYAGDATPKQRQMFRDSLHAALTVDEVRAICAKVGIPPSCVRATTDRHWTIAWRKPPAG